MQFVNSMFIILSFQRIYIFPLHTKFRNKQITTKQNKKKTTPGIRKEVGVGSGGNRNLKNTSLNFLKDPLLIFCLRI